jgi:hypothetical protein
MWLAELDVARFFGRKTSPRRLIETMRAGGLGVSSKGRKG